MLVLFIHSPERKTPIRQWQGYPERSRRSWWFCLARAEMSGKTTKVRANKRPNWVLSLTLPLSNKNRQLCRICKLDGEPLFFALRFSFNRVVRKEMPTMQHDKGTNKQTNKQNKLWRWSGTRLFHIGVCQDSFPFYSKTDIIWWSTTKALLSPESWTPFLCKSFGKNYFIDPYRDRCYMVAYQGFRMRLSIKL